MLRNVRQSVTTRTLGESGSPALVSVTWLSSSVTIV
jgi:hypothetical protein